MKHSIVPLQQKQYRIEDRIKDYEDDLNLNLDKWDYLRDKKKTMSPLDAKYQEVKDQIKHYDLQIQMLKKKMEPLKKKLKEIEKKIQKETFDACCENRYMTLETLPPRKKGLDWDRFIKDEDEMREFEKKWKW